MGKTDIIIPWSFLTFVFQYSRNTVLLSAPLRVFTHYRLEFHSIRELVLRTQTARIVLLPVGRQVGTFILAEWVTQKCSKSRFAKSSSGHYSHGSDQTVFNSLILLFDSVIHQKKWETPDA
jgi:hypothetical protein